MRFEERNVCTECVQHSGSCGGVNACHEIRAPLRPFDGIRLTADGFDCALPLTFDSHSVCSFGCLYCFAPNLITHRAASQAPIGQTSLQKIEQIFAGTGGKSAALYRKALKYDNLKNGYPCPVQVGGLCDPLDNIERNQGWFLKFVELAKKYNQPVRISTKGNLFLEQEYLDAIADRPELFWITYSIISIDDDIIKQVDKRAPVASDRLQSMQNLTDIGVKTGLRFRPMIPGISDATKNYPNAYADLINAAADAGATSLSYEVAFLPGAMTPDLHARWEEIEHIADKPLMKIYESFGKKQSCNRPSHAWTEEIMHAVYRVGKSRGLQIGVSDPVWKQLNECGCCCGITEDDPVFGNWQTESATNQLLIAKRDGKFLRASDIVPAWAREAKADLMTNPGTGPLVQFKRRHEMWSDKLEELWENPAKERSPLQYFQGALMPVKRDAEGNLVYKYVGLKRVHPKKTPYWTVNNVKE